MIEFEAGGVKRNPAVKNGMSTVSFITRYRVAEVGQMHADLMFASGFEANF